MTQEENPIFLPFLFARESLGSAASQLRGTSSSQLLLIGLMRNQPPSFSCGYLALSLWMGTSDHGAQVLLAHHHHFIDMETEVQRGKRFAKAHRNKRGQELGLLLERGGGHCCHSCATVGTLRLCKCVTSTSPQPGMCLDRAWQRWLAKSRVHVVPTAWPVLLQKWVQLSVCLKGAPSLLGDMDMRKIQSGFWAVF